MCVYRVNNCLKLMCYVTVLYIHSIKNQYRKCLHRDVASTVQIITVHKMQNSSHYIATGSKF